jgi:tripeptide aminopeptidase
MPPARRVPLIDRVASESLVIELMTVPGPSGREDAIAHLIADRLARAGVPERAIRRDAVHRKSPFGGECGNLIVKLPGSRGRGREPRRMLMAHLDTVPLAAGCQPRRRGRQVVSVRPGTALGADNRSGSAAILSALLTIIRHEVPHPPLTFLWCVQEEVGLCGSRYVSPKDLGRPAMAFNFDGGDPERVTIGATGAYRMSIHVSGVASHAGVYPERGVSATAIAALAIADLQSSGWHGLILRRGRRGTSNVGVIRGGEATNVVTDRLELRAEARAHDRRLRQRIVDEYRKAFERAARSVRNHEGRAGSVAMHVTHDYESFRLDSGQACVAEACRAIELLGLQPQHRVADGGLDANWTHAHGIPTVSLGCGQHNIHTVDEYLDLDEFHISCRLAAALAIG